MVKSMVGRTNSKAAMLVNTAALTKAAYGKEACEVSAWCTCFQLGHEKEVSHTLICFKPLGSRLFWLTRLNVVMDIEPVRVSRQIEIARA